MKYSLFTGTLTLLLLLLTSPLSAGEKPWEQIADDIRQTTRDKEKEAAKSIHLITLEKKELQAHQTRLKTDLEKQKQALQQLKASFEKLSRQKDLLEKDFSTRAMELENLEETVRDSVRKGLKQISASHLTPQHPSRGEELIAFLASDRYPDIPLLDALAEVYLMEIKQGKEKTIYPTRIITSTGEDAEGTVARIGTFASYYLLENGDAGFLQLEKGGRLLKAVPASPGWGTKRAIRRFIQKKSGSLPVDVSKGQVFTLMTARKNFGEWLKSGGTLLWPILLVGITGLALGIERAFVLFHHKKASAAVVSLTQEQIRDNNWEACEKDLSLETRNPTCRVLKKILENRGETEEILENTLQEAIMTELPGLERGLSTLAVLSAIAPLLGLLGTVTGMIGTFQSITLFGTANPRLMSGGISEALITTQTGLAVAIPLILIHHFLKRRVEIITADMEENGMALSVQILKNRDES